MTEYVLVTPTRLLHELGVFHGLNRDVQRYLPTLLAPEHLTFLPRAQAEDDPTFKQIIPYVVLRHGDRVFNYTRGEGSNEKRLRALRSVGIGGHINPGDLEAGTSAYWRGMWRELAEEVCIETPYRDHCLGLINDDTTPVGRVHLGIVHVLELEAPRVRRREADLLYSGFAPLPELCQATNEFETWSRFVLEALHQP
ncbi:MAG: phosphoesterase [Gemmataceae bacterium]|nr:phosphoesterase [Gemmataceae bacterium]